MATILLQPNSAIFPDGTASNEQPIMVLNKVTAATPDAFFMQLRFSPTATNSIWYNFRMPDDYTSDLTAVIQWYANATTGQAVWDARVGGGPAGSTVAMDGSTGDLDLDSSNADTSAVPATAYYLIEKSIPILNDKGIGAGDWCMLQISRLGADASDTLSTNAELVAVSLEYS